MKNSQTDFTAEDLYDFLDSVKKSISLDSIPTECKRDLTITGVYLAYRGEDSPYIHLITPDDASINET